MRGVEIRRFCSLKSVLSTIEGLNPLSRAIAFRYSISQLNEIGSEQIFNARLTKE